MKASVPGYFFASVLAVLLAAIVLTPLLFPYGHFTGLGGSAGVMDHSWRISEAVYALGDMFCHQNTDRSFIVNGSQTAFCTRDTGMIAGCALSLPALGHLLEKKDVPGRKLNILGLLFLSVLIAEWAIGAIVGYDVKYLRFASGAVGGTGIALLIQSYVFTVWKGEGAG